ncbi:hypothetical protein [Intrasporangium sp. YIM S08009]|uniref:hypothetical protein n=1 Tax=Intrasporangium zincisolvens TaxID=3080018 RepID=UPI002B0590CE|nr:hypothetical protein [Intrasporangium sp. YIM S08009]
MRLEQGRWPAGLVALAGVALVVPSLGSPTWQQTVSAPERGEILSRQQQFSWGRQVVEGFAGSLFGIVENPAGRVVLTALVVVAGGAALAWLVVPGRVAVVAPIAVALLLGHVASSATQRLGRSLADRAPAAPGLEYVGGSTDAGSAETAAAVVLLAALAAMLVTLLRGARRDASHRTAMDEDAVLEPVGRHLEGPAVDLVDTERPTAPRPGGGPS